PDPLRRRSSTRQAEYPEGEDRGGEHRQSPCHRRRPLVHLSPAVGPVNKPEPPAEPAGNWRERQARGQATSEQQEQRIADGTHPGSSSDSAGDGADFVPVGAGGAVTRGCPSPRKVVIHNRQAKRGPGPSRARATGEVDQSAVSSGRRAIPSQVTDAPSRMKSTATTNRAPAAARTTVPRRPASGPVVISTGCPARRSRSRWTARPSPSTAWSRRRSDTSPAWSGTTRARTTRPVWNA